LIVNLLLPSVTALLNRGIHSRRDAVEMCEQLVGRTMVTRVEGLPTGSWAICVAASYDGIAITPASAEAIEAADAVIAGTPLELRRLMFADRTESLRSGRVSFEGDIEIADKFRELLVTARPDLEERLVAWIGEPAAFQITNWIRDARDWFLDASDDMAACTGQYLQEDSRQLPTGEEMNEFCAAVDDAANDVDRLAARIEHIAESRR